MEEIQAYEMLEILGVPGESDIGEFFKHYFDCSSELVALKRCGFTYNILKKWKADIELNYLANKMIIDEYKISLVEDSVMAEARSGSYKHAEFVLTNRSDNYKKKKENKEGISVDDIVNEVLSG